MSDEQTDVRPIWEYTSRVRKHAEQSPHGGAGGPYGMYMGRHIIGRDSRVFGGIDFDVGHRNEMVVVSHDEPDLPALYGKLVDGIRAGGLTKIRDVLRLVYHTVHDALPYDYFGKLRLIREVTKGKAECKLPLALFVRYRVGVCREQGLLAAYLVERLIDDGIIGGRISVDRSIQRLRWWEVPLNVLFYREWSLYGGHEWARYTAPDGTIYVIDVAQGYCGPMWESSGSWGWTYARPDDVRPANVKPPLPPLLDPLDYALLATGLAWLIWHFA